MLTRNWLRGFLTPSLDRSFRDSARRNGLRALACAGAVLILAALGVAPAWAGGAVAVLLAVYEAYLAGVGRDRRTARDSLYDWTGGALGAATGAAAAAGWLAGAVVLGVAAGGLTLARAVRAD